MQIITPLIITLVSFGLAGCDTPKTSSGSTPISKLSTSNLIRNPQTGVYRVVVVNTNNIIERFTPKTNSTLYTNAITIEPGNVVHFTAPVISIDISSSTNLTRNPQTGAVTAIVTQYKPKTDWTKLGMCYLILLHLMVVGYYLYDRRAFKKLSNPFKKKSLTKPRSAVKKKSS